MHWNRKQNDLWPFVHFSVLNSTCCCKETPSRTALYWNQQSFLFLPVHTHFLQAYVVWNVHIYSKRTSVCCVNWIALKFKGVYWMTELFWKQLLNEAQVKIIVISSSCWLRFIAATCSIGIELKSFYWVANWIKIKSKSFWLWKYWSLLNWNLSDHQKPESI